MRLRSIEPTPNPNNMKLNLEESLPTGVRFNYSLDSAQRDGFPETIRHLLQIPGVKSLYHCLDFIAVQRVSSADWQNILNAARRILSKDGPIPGGDGASSPSAATDSAEGGSLGVVKIFIQYFRRIPLLVKAQTPAPRSPSGETSEVIEEYRASLPPRFAAAVMAAAPSAPNMLIERRWTPVEPRYGELREVGDAVAAEIDASYSEGRLESLVKQAFEKGAGGADVKESRRAYPDEELDALLASSDWKQRYTAVESIGANPARFTQLATAMQDPHISVRRMATIYLGLLKNPNTLAPLIAALKDPAAVIRRTAGDALNDLAPAPPDRSLAIAAMIEALGDKNKLVRWRAARFLYELGDATAIPALRVAAEAPEFEVKLQAAQALERIEGGREAAGPIWMQMTNTTNITNKQDLK